MKHSWNKMKKWWNKSINGRKERVSSDPLTVFEDIKPGSRAGGSESSGSYWFEASLNVLKHIKFNFPS